MISFTLFNRGFEEFSGKGIVKGYRADSENSPYPLTHISTQQLPFSEAIATVCRPTGFPDGATSSRTIGIYINTRSDYHSICP